jgi:hypothetical protein
VPSTKLSDGHSQSARFIRFIICGRGTRAMAAVVVAGASDAAGDTLSDDLAGLNGGNGRIDRTLGFQTHAIGST